MKIFLDMVGCRLNQAEIDAMAVDLVIRGAKIVSDPQSADTIIVNTCCVTAKASADSRKMLRHYKNKYSAKVVSTGCWVSVARPEAEEISDLAYLNDQKELIPEYLIKSPPDSFLEPNQKPSLGRRQRTRGFVKVQDGCDNACSYCLTTIARGDSFSTTTEDVLGRIALLEKMGSKEVVLTGVQLGSWGKDLDPNQRLHNLLRSILENSTVPRIRLSSLEPWDIDLELVELLNHPRVMPHLHIPLQSGSESILRAMRRPLRLARFSQILAMIRQVSPQTAISTDIITGFPGETEPLFEESLDYIRSCDFSGGHVFSFSPMPGTAASELPDQVQTATVKARTKRLLAYFASQQAAYKLKKVGQREPVLFERKKTTPLGSYYTGFSEDYQRVICFSAEALVNQIKGVKIIEMSEKGDLVGRVETTQTECSSS
ncbi:MAG: MiaB/RimO family radical SAM methylthiotransferase [Anaerolineaceae bacterium]|nr:MiaB/RimO family radical SAM methylthiotransferase [Anaerolineaceae bacterium]